MSWKDENLIQTLEENGVVVIPTDTIYGIVGKALNNSVVNRIFSIRKRAGNKPCIILIGDLKELEKFSIKLSEVQKNTVLHYWPGPVSIVFDCPLDSFAYLHRGTKTLAFRLPKQEELQNLLKKSGPLIAPSANMEGLPPAKNILEAKNYFGNLVDLYIDGGEVVGKPSKIIKLKDDGSILVIRN